MKMNKTNFIYIQIFIILLLSNSCTTTNKASIYIECENKTIKQCLDDFQDYINSKR